MKSEIRSVYTAFDPYPSYKGSSIHIEKVTGVLSELYGKTLLLTLPRQAKRLRNRKIKHQVFKSDKANFLNRGLDYSRWVDEQLDNQYQLQVGHFRDIWGGLAILKRPHLTSVFEVNGLPSIELRDRYASIPESTITKLRELENQCLTNCDHIICPSLTIKTHLIGRGVVPDKIHIIPNGATLPDVQKIKKAIPHPYIIYFGALQPWQGISVLLKAMQYLADKPELKLVICSSHKEKQSRSYQKLSQKLGIADQVIWKHKLSQKELHALISNAVASIAPLTECARNLEQGCSPLKVFETMACKAPLIASDLPVIREIVIPDQEAKLVRPDRPAELARAIRLLYDYPEFGKSMALNGFQKLEKEFTWEKIDLQLSSFYQNLVTLAYT